MSDKEYRDLLIKRRNKLQAEIDAINSILNIEPEGDSDDALDNFHFYITSNENKDKGSIKKYYQNALKSEYGTNEYRRFSLDIVNQIKVEAKDKDTTWKNYLLSVIRKLGGTVKTSEIANAVILANKEVSFVQARQTAADVLPELVKEGKLQIEKGDSRKEGNIYKLY